MNTSTHKYPFLPFALISLAAAASVNTQSVVHAADRTHKEQHVLRVSFADLDLTSTKGTVTLYTRIRNAARTVCGPVDIDLPDDSADWTRCVDDAIANAVATVGDANLTDYYLVKTNRSHTRVVHR